MIREDSEIAKFISELETELKNPLPGKDAQRLMAPSLRLPGISAFKSKTFKSSSVLILLYPDKSRLNTVFILRTLSGPHSGEISLPGGKTEKNDSSAEYTALRECQEEIGVKIQDVRIIGKLTELYVPFSNYMINPFVGYIDYTPTFIPNKSEVDEIIQVSLIDLFSKSNRLSKPLRLAFIKVNAPYYNIKEKHVWGATAMIISELNEVYKTLSKFKG